MPRIAYVNGRYVPHDAARVHVEDRGFQFADGVYEVIAVRDGRLADTDGHLNRLDRSLRELRMAWPMSRRALTGVIARMMRVNLLRDGLIYLQVTRGRAARDFAFPQSTATTLVITCTAKPRLPAAIAPIRVKITPDLRWARRDIKTVALLPAVLAKQAAVEAGAQEAWMVDAQGKVTEGASSNAWIVTADGAVVTRPADHGILRGITRDSVHAIAESLGLRYEERAFDLAEAYNAQEAFVTSANTVVTPVGWIDDRPIGNGVAGPVATRLRQAYIDRWMGDA